jgi:hypothetical protein
MFYLCINKNTKMKKIKWHKYFIVALLIWVVNSITTIKNI